MKAHLAAKRPCIEVCEYTKCGHTFARRAVVLFHKESFVFYYLLSLFSAKS